MPRSKATEETDKLTRIAIVNADKCKPKRCRQECKKSCPVVRMGKLCIEVTPNSKIASISEELCIGCGICVKVIILHYQLSHNKYISIIAGIRLAVTLYTCLCRNVLSKQLRLSTCLVTWNVTPHIDTVRTHSNFIDSRSHDLVKCWDLSVLMVSGNPLLSKS